MPARAWILIFALAGGSISLAIGVASVVGSTLWVLIFAGVGFVVTLLAATVAYHYTQMSEWDSATVADELEANSRTARWPIRSRGPYASNGPENM
jgi:hypothetical protein